MARRGISTTGRRDDGETPTAEADGLFVNVDSQRIADMKTWRDAPG